MRKIILSLVLLCTFTAGYSQFFNSGQDPASVRWNQLSTTHYKIVYPNHFKAGALKVGGYVDAIRGSANYGLGVEANRFPIVLHTMNPYSNGVVTWAPKRMELITMPPVEQFSVPWLKQVTAHEYRHIVQMSGLNRHFVKGASYVLGQQVVGLASAILPRWFLEGDATYAETQLSMNGRGVQPEFSIEYRAIYGSGQAKNFPIDKFFCGSYKHKIPNYYQLGYQMVSWSNTKYGYYFWEHILEHTSRYPFAIFNPWIVMRRDYKTSSNGLFRGAFGELSELWQPLAKRENSSQIIPLKVRAYSVYKEPLELYDSVYISVLESFSDIDKIVEVSTKNGKTTQKRVAYANTLSSRVEADVEGNLYWTEYRPSLFWSQASSSVIRRKGVGERRIKTLTKPKKQGDVICLFVTPTAQNEIAYVNYDPQNGYDIVLNDRRIELGNDLSVHGLTWSSEHQKLYYLALTDDGMGIYSIDGDTIKPPTYVALNSLRARESRLFFTSTQSGLDEGHYIDIDTKQEYRITTSRYGSKSPSAATGGAIVTTYTPDGYMLANQAINPIQVEQSKMPENLVNPVSAQWNVMKMDTINVADNIPKGEIKKYRKGANLFGVHSWAPIYYDPYSIMNEQTVDVAFGATVLSQNLLGTTEAMLGYAYTADGYSKVQARFNYTGWAPKIEIKATYGGGYRNVYAVKNIITYDDYQVLKKPNVDLRARIYLPINLSNGNYYRVLTPDVTFSYDNSIVSESLQKSKRYKTDLSFRLNYTSNRHQAYRDFLPKFGYTAQFEYVTTVGTKSFGKLAALYLRGFLPGVAPQHSLMLRAALQYQKLSDMNYSSKLLFPKGCDYSDPARDYYAVAVDYQLPLAYPDGGIPDVIYFKRIRANLFFNYAIYNVPAYDRTQTGTHRVYDLTHKYSYGCDILLEINPLSSSFPVTLKFTGYKPNDGKFGFAAGFDIAF